MSGLTLVTVPIGNVEDISFRAKQKLQDCSIIVAEDTRVLKELLTRLEIDYSQKRIWAFHDHSEETTLQGILKSMSEEEVVYTSDAGSPVISDPALPLVRLAIENNIEVQSLPGANAPMVALELSGLPATPFHFHGFLGREKAKVEQFVQLMQSQYGTHIFFEGVSRVKKTMDILSKELPDWDFAICRELTKTFQSVHRFKGSEWAAIKEAVTEKGEFVLLAHNPQKKSTGSAQVSGLAQEILAKGARPKLLAKLLAEITGENSKEIYSKLDNR
ncbi:MAG: 16S rRNA (cytidine(1402)-2'-O)-methyltransferase [Bacteriovoracaceae bacterium]|nr:16S rRNA (cytidine(1402)-2'-O)-methyltransferase [Bacteriovoracaceae bacterium]